MRSPSMLCGGPAHSRRGPSPTFVRCGMGHSRRFAPQTSLFLRRGLCGKGWGGRLIAAPTAVFGRLSDAYPSASVGTDIIRPVPRCGQPQPKGDAIKRAGTTGAAHGECTGAFAHRRCAPAVFDAAPNLKFIPRAHKMGSVWGPGAQPLVIPPRTASQPSGRAGRSRRGGRSSERGWWCR